MTGPKPLRRRLLFFLPLLAALLFLPAPRKAVPPLLALGLALAYARIAAFIEGERGREELLLAALAFPFGLAGAGYYGFLDPAGLLISGLGAGLAFAALLALERFLAPREKGFALVLGFLILFAAMLCILERLPSSLGLGGSVLVLGLSTYAAARRGS